MTMDEAAYCALAWAAGQQQNQLGQQLGLSGASVCAGIADFLDRFSGARVRLGLYGSDRKALVPKAIEKFHEARKRSPSLGSLGTNAQPIRNPMPRVQRDPDAPYEHPTAARNEEIRKAVSGGMKQCEAAKLYGLSRNRIWQICNPHKHHDEDVQRWIDRGLPLRAANCLVMDKILTVEDLRKVSDHFLLITPNFGRKSLAAVHAFLQEHAND